MLLSGTPRLLRLYVIVLLLCVRFGDERGSAVAAATGGDQKIAGRKLVLAVDGGTESIRAGLFDAADGRIVGTIGVAPYATHHPHPGWAEQHPQDWWEKLGHAVRQAVDGWKREQEQRPEGKDEDTICAVALDTTCCSVVALDENYEPVRPCLLWMDQRSADAAAQIVRAAAGDPALAVNNDGAGPVSAEWMTPKALWLATQTRDVWENQIRYLCEYQDYMNYRLTGILCASSCNAATRWHWDGKKCTLPATAADPYPGRPLSLYNRIGMPELAEKLPQRCLPMGAVIGPLTDEAAAHLHLPRGIPVVQGGPDAFVGMVGLGCIQPGQMCLITGSSHLHCVVAQSANTAMGIWGAYRGAPLPVINFAEGGQSSTGSMLRWIKHQLLADRLSYRELDEEAALIEPGADGLVAVETWQGSRTPVTDALARGAFLGLTLSHTRAHVWRAALEAVCFGTRACLEALAAAGHDCHEIVLAGGVTNSDFWLQMHADVTGRPIVLCEGSDRAMLLGGAILASVQGAGVHEDVAAAVGSMVRHTRTVRPNRLHQKAYDEAYARYLRATAAARQVTSSSSQPVPDEQELQGQEPRQHAGKDPQNPVTIISPSLLACDWADMRSEVRRCQDAGLTRLHVDVFDGVYIDSPAALTFGPQMVAAIRQSCGAAREGGAATASGRRGEVDLQLDVHLCVDRPERFVGALADAGATRLIFQWEAMEGDLSRAAALCQDIRNAGMIPGVSINPATPVEDIFPLLSFGKRQPEDDHDDDDHRLLVGLVDILAVEPGFGGQSFQPSCLAKIAALASWRTRQMIPKTSIQNGALSFDIMVDGGINPETVASAVECGANVLVAGTYLFQSSSGGGIGAAARALLHAATTSTTT